MSVLMRAGVRAAESGHLPDVVLAAGIRQLLASRLARLEVEYRGDGDSQRIGRPSGSRAVAASVDAANEQHYEVPPAFFELVLGRALKYSCCWWDSAEADLDSAEAAMLDRTMDRAGIENGMDVLDLGCGWGSLTLTAARRYPETRFTAVSNSRLQIDFIRRRATEIGLRNVVAERADINDYEPGEEFDRIISVEMLEHVQDHRRLLRDLAGWVRPHGELFVHVFCHHRHEYPFETSGASNWMGRNFFTGGMMPSSGTIPRAADRSGAWQLSDEWQIDGNHYARTADAWLRRLDEARPEARQILADSSPDPARAVQRWRMFFLAVRETFAYRDGSEWGVGHYRFVRRT